MNPKTFDQVKIGDTAYMVQTFDLAPSEELAGTIIWKGSFSDLEKHYKYSNYAKQESIEDMEIADLHEYDWVLVDTKTDGIILFNYRCDPSGVVTYTKELGTLDNSLLMLDHYVQNDELNKLAGRYINSKEGPELYFVSVGNKVFNNQGVPMSRTDEKYFVVGVSTDKTLAESIYKDIECSQDTEVKYVCMEGINGTIIEYIATMLPIEYRFKEKVYDQN